MSLSEDTKRLLNKHRFTIRKSLGQNFMVDASSLERIIKGAGITKEDTVIEVGTGTGLLTKELSKHAKNVISYELDKKILPIAKEYLAGTDNVELLNADILEAAISGMDLKCVANVPYYITTPIIEKIIENKEHFSSAVLTVQKEFAERMAAAPGTKEYGSFTVFINFYTEPKLLFQIPKTSFLPQPAVGSAVIRLDIRKELLVCVNDKLFFRVVRAAFSQRRKTLRNCLLTVFDPAKTDEALSKAGIDPKRRGETLSIREFADISNNIA